MTFALGVSCLLVCPSVWSFPGASLIGFEVGSSSRSPTKEMGCVRPSLPGSMDLSVPPFVMVTWIPWLAVTILFLLVVNQQPMCLGGRAPVGPGKRKGRVEAGSWTERTRHSVWDRDRSSFRWY
jgi:hypothetical protein